MQRCIQMKERFIWVDWESLAPIPFAILMKMVLYIFLFAVVSEFVNNGHNVHMNQACKQPLV